MLILSIIILTLPYFDKNLFDKVMNVNKIVFTPWYRLENCQNNGMLLCYVDDLQFIKNPVPANYSQNKITEIMDQAASSSATVNTNQSQIKPNIILILSESLWDATKLPAIKLTPDPLVNIRQDIKGNFISPMYGGGTANVEFEVLTGLSNYLFDQESFPYTDLITKKMPSLFTVFNDNQYPTTVVHPYAPTFYNRDNVYKYFGLGKFTSLDQMSDPQMAGPFVSDKYFMDQILKQFNSSDQPQFIFGISMQNHDIYEANRYKDKQVKISGNLSQQAKDTLQTYADGINLTDKDYKYLKDELTKEKNKPTIVIMFGDHLPFLGDDYDVYQEGKLVSNNEGNWSQKDEVNMHTTPLTIWSNYQVKLPQLDNISPEILSNEILDLANIKPEYQFKFTDEIKQKIPVLTKKVSSDVSQYQDLIGNYKLVQYDILFGKQYIKEIK
jgi:phosphoglycerol transferase MdoB-like AlkP superfamily enzyme